MHESEKKIRFDSCRLEMTVKAISLQRQDGTGRKMKSTRIRKFHADERVTFTRRPPFWKLNFHRTNRSIVTLHCGSWNTSFSVCSIYCFAIFVPSFSNVSLSAPTKSLLHLHKRNDSFRKILKRFWSLESTTIFDSVTMLIMIILITRTGTSKSDANNVIITYYGRWMHIQFVWCNNNTVINNNR